jgi:tetratricopeptide (TPR) repeat protein
VRGQQGKSEEAIADYTRAIELPGAPAEPVANALVNRGVVRGQQGKSEEAIADYTRAIELPGAPAEQVANALVNRGWARYQTNEYESFLSDTERAIRADATNPSANANLGLARLAVRKDAEALVAYQTMVVRYPSICREALTDVREAQKTWLSADRARPILDLLERTCGDPPPA